MKTQAFDLYGGLLPAGFVQDNEHPIGKDQQAEERFWTGNPLKELPTSAKRLKGVVLSISSFKPGFMEVGGLHVNVWLSLGDTAVGKEGEGVFIHGNTGDSGACNLAVMGLDIPILTNKFRINVWAHNMRSKPADWHVTGVLFYDEDSD